MSTLLHPSLKHFQIASHEKDKAIKLIKQELVKRTSLAQVVTDSNTINKPTSTTCNLPPPVSSDDLLSRCFDQPLPVAEVDDELDHYMALDVFLHEKDDVLIFWKEHSTKFPMLSSIVRDLYAIPASNTIVERLFSWSKNTVTDRRTNLAAEKINKLLFLQNKTCLLETNK